MPDITHITKSFNFSQRTDNIFSRNLNTKRSGVTHMVEKEL